MMEAFQIRKKRLNIKEIRHLATETLWIMLKLLNPADPDVDVLLDELNRRK